MSSGELVTSPWRALRRLHDQQLRDEHRIRDTSYQLIFFAAFGGCIIQIYFLLQMTSPSYRVLKLVMQLYRVLYYIPTFVLAHRLRRYQNRTDTPEASCFLSIPALANFSLLCTVFAVCFSLIARTIIGQCDDNESMQACNPDHDYNSLPQDGVLAMLLVVLVTQVLVKCYHVWVLLVAWVACTASVVFCISFISASRSHNTLFFCFIMGFIMYEYERHVMVSYAALRNMDQSIRTQMHAENEMRVMEMRSVEMRHLLGNVAHDLKTPMQSFVMELELLDKLLDKVEGGNTASAMRESLQRINHTNSFMNMIINRAIDYVKTSASLNLCPQLTSVDFVACIEWTFDVLRASSSVPLLLDTIPNNISRYIITDKQWLLENILCLVSNAAKFTSSGAIRVRCEVQNNDGEGDMLYIEVVDTGIGMPEMTGEASFQLYQQTTRVTGGTGLGLYSLRNRVRALGGECGAKGRQDGTPGACVWFTIPYQCDAEVAVAKIEPAFTGIELINVNIDNNSRNDVNDVSSASIPSCPRSMRILVVDDSAMIRKSINKVLLNEGLHVDLAENGLVALEMMELHKYDVVLMDVQMPVMDGLAATRRRREMEMKECAGNTEMHRQIIIGVSAYTDGPPTFDAAAAGMDGFMEKPFSLKKFMEICKGISTLQNRVETL